MNLITHLLAVLAVVAGISIDARAQRTLVSSSSQYGFRTYTPASVETYSIWVNMPQTNVLSALISTTRGLDGALHYRALGYEVGYFYATERNGGAGYNSQSNGLPKPSTWIHLVAVFKGNTNRTLWVNGVAAAPETTTVTPTSIDEVYLGRFFIVSDRFCSASIVEPAIWHAELTDAEIGQLAAGGQFARRAHPSKIRPDKLVWLPDLSIPGAAVPGIGGVTGISNSPAQLNVLPAPFK